VGKIVVFDSGFGSLSIIKAIQKTTKADIIYFADQKNFPYGKKSKNQLKKIIIQTIKMLQSQFNPELIVLGSNTPSLLLSKYINSNLVSVLPPIKQAIKLSKTSYIAILATQSAVKSKELSNYIKKNQIPKQIKIKKIDATTLIELVESGKFIDSPSFCKSKIKSLLKKVLTKNNIDVVTLSSTHLPFLLPLLKKEFPDIIFLDPANEVAQRIAKVRFKNKSKCNTLKVFTSSNPKVFEKYLKKIGIKNKVSFLASV
jgi:glutamate racemase